VRLQQRARWHLISARKPGLWLDTTVTDPLVVVSCLRPHPAQEMEAYPVGPLVSSAWNEGPELIEPLGPHRARLCSS